MANKVGSFPWSLSQAQQALLQKSDPETSVLLDPTLDDLDKVIQLWDKAPVPGYKFTMKVIHHPLVLKLFLARMEALEERKKTKQNTPRLENAQDTEILQSLENEAKKHPSTYKYVKFVLMAFGATEFSLKSILSTGYHDYSLLSSGQGIANTSWIKYAFLDGGAIVLNYVGYYSAVASDSGLEGTSKDTRLLRSDARYAIMAPRDDSKPDEVLFEPIEKGKKYAYTYDELVTAPEQVLPKYQVILVPGPLELPTQLLQGQKIRTLKAAIERYLSQNRRDEHLNAALKKKLEALSMYSDDRDPLDKAGIAFLAILDRLLTLADSFAQRNLSAKLKKNLASQGFLNLSTRIDHAALIASIKKAAACQKKMDQAHLLMIEGEEHRLQGNHPAAFHCFDKALKKDPTHPLTLCRRAALYTVNAKWEEAHKDFNQCIVHDPFNAGAFTGRANMFRLQNDFSRALEDSRRALELNLNCALAYRVRGACLLVQGQAALALDDYNNALDIEPDNSFALAQRGQILWSMNEFEKASIDLNKCQHIDKYPAALEIQGELFFRVKDLENALAVFNKCVETNHSNINVFIKLGIIYRLLKNYPQSLEHLDLALKMDRSNTTTLTERGLTFAAAGIRDQALDAFSNVLMMNPSILIAKAGRGELYLLQGNKEGAFADFSDVAKAYFNDNNFEQALIYINKCLQLRPDNTDFLKKRGSVKAKLGERAEAIHDYNQCILIDNYDMEAFYERGVLHFSNSNFPQALSDFDRCCTQNPQNTKALLGRAKVNCLLKKSDEALRDFNEVLRFEPNNTFAKLQVAQLSSNSNPSTPKSQSQTLQMQVKQNPDIRNSWANF